MDSPLPPDPYAALGLTSSATATQIKTAYRKMALQCHPDKIQDETLKRQKADEFHKIQQAYDILGDEDQRSRYDAQVRLAELRAEALKRQGGSRPVEVRTASYDFRTSRAPSATYEGRGSSRAYEDRQSPHAYDEYQPYEDQRSSARKSDGYEASSRRPPARSSRASDDARDRARVELSYKEKERAERRRARERETRQEREGKYNTYFEDEGEEERYRYGSDSRRRDDERRRGPLLEERRRQERLDYNDDTERKMSHHTETARDYMERSRSGSVEIEARPQTYRSSSARDYEVRRGDSRPAVVRKLSNRPAPSGKVERRGSPPEIVEWPAGSSRERKETPKPPPLVTSSSTPLTVKIPSSTRDPPPRQYTAVRTEPPPQPSPLRRAETMPVPAHGSLSNRRKESTPVTSSKLRNAETHDSGYSSPGTPDAAQYVETPQSAKSTKYYYSNPNDEYVSNYRQEAFPDDSERRPRQRTPSPILEGHYGTDRESTPRASRADRESSSRYPPPSRSASYATYTATPVATTAPSTPFSPSSQRPKPSRTESTRGAASSPHILRSGGSIGSSGRDRLYGEIPSTPRADNSPSSRAEYKNVQYAKPVRAEDAKYADYYPTGRRGNGSGSGRRGSESEDYGYAAYGSYRDSDRDTYNRPRMGRSATYAYG